MATSTSFLYASALRGSAGRDGGSQRPPVQVPPLHHVPALSANAVFIDLRVVEPSVTTEERNDFSSKIFSYLLMRCPKSGPNPIHSWSPGNAVTAVRLTGVPASLPDTAIREHFSQFGRVTRVFETKDKVFTRAANGIAHISIAVAPWFTLPWSMQMAAQTREC
jgi:hypothetical protein